MEQVIARPPREMPYQTVGDVTITMAGGASATNYRRSLDLDTAIARTSFHVGNTRYAREVFASPVDQVIVCRLTASDPNAPASAPGRLTATIAMSTPMAASVRTEGDDTLVLAGVNGDAFGIKGALTYQARVRVLVDGGSIAADGTQLRIVAAKSATLLIAAATSFRRYDDVSGDPAAATRQVIAAAANRPLDALRDDHVAEHRRLFRRVTLDLGSTPSAALPTDERIRNFAGGDDPQLAALYFQYGRYLLISSSRPGTQPANLQGIWNDSTNPPWASNYTTNINTQMNYWPAEVANLAECAEPLFTMIAELAETGARTARTHYGARGWVTHHNTDLWRNTAPVDGPRSGMWPTGGAWLATHLWEHYLYSGDKAFLARAYPVMKGAAEFFVDTLVEDPSGRWLVTSPSLSPENRHHPDATVAAGPAMDSQILRDLFSQVIEAGRALGVDDALPQGADRYARQARAGSDWGSRPVAGVAGRLGHDRARAPASARVPSLRRLPERSVVERHHAGPDSGGTPLAGHPRRRVDGVGHGLACRPLGQARRSRAGVPPARVPAVARPLVPEPVRRAPALSDRRELRGHGSHRRDAAAVSRRHASPVAGAAEGVASGTGHRAAGTRRLRGRSRVAGRDTAPRDDSVHLGHDRPASSGHNGTHRNDEARRRTVVGREVETVS